MEPETRLPTAAYLVLGMVDQLGAATPYALKNFAAISVNRFWALPHTQIYAQCDRLLEAGLLSEEREPAGRRRRSFALTPAGRKALAAWVAAPAPEPYELRSLATLKLFFGAEPRELATEQLATHRAQLAQYRELQGLDVLLPGQRLALELGIGHELEFIRYWSSLAGGESAAPGEPGGESA